jgi:immunoglobulin-binding protein 1
MLPPEPKKPMTVAEMRAAKIAEFKLQKSLTTKIADLESKLDEEDLRQWALSLIELAVLRTRQNLSSLESELDILASKPPSPPQPIQSREYSERLDRMPTSSLPKSGPLLSGEGKVMRPFVLTSKRDQLSQEVFRPDHALPTMSIDDYLTEEIRRGGIQVPQEDKIQGKNRPKTTREEEEEEDRETEKKREWDEFTDTHARGSGNMGFNRG